MPDKMTTLPRGVRLRASFGNKRKDWYECVSTGEERTWDATQGVVGVTHGVRVTSKYAFNLFLHPEDFAEMWGEPS